MDQRLQYHGWCKHSKDRLELAPENRFGRRLCVVSVSRHSYHDGKLLGFIVSINDIDTKQERRCFKHYKYRSVAVLSACFDFNLYREKPVESEV